MKILVTLIFAVFLVHTAHAQRLKEDVFFKSDGITLAGSIYYPSKKKGPFPTFIIVHGPGAFPRSFYEYYAKTFNENGYAVMIYDKRGTGRSQGTYRYISRRTSEKRFGELSQDVQAAYNYLQSKSRVSDSKIGLLGFSQGGWIIPIVAGNNDDLYCSIIVSGPVVSVGEEILYSRLTGDGFPRSYTKINYEKIYERVFNYRGKPGFTPIPHITKMNAPSLWIYGEKDRCVPAKVSVDKLNDIATAHAKENFATVIYPNGDHKLRDVRTRKYIDYFGDVFNWLSNINGRTRSVSTDD